MSTASETRSCYALVLDICGTLLEDNTTRSYLDGIALRGWRRSCRDLALSRWGALLDAKVSSGASRALGVFSLRGLAMASLAEWGRRYATAALARNVVPEVLAWVQDFQSRGRPVYLASATLDVVAEPLARELRCAGWVASRLASAHGCCLGRFVCDATGRKAELLRQRHPEVDLAACAVLTDNPEDTDLLQLAAVPIFLGSPGATPPPPSSAVAR